MQLCTRSSHPNSLPGFSSEADLIRLSFGHTQRHVGQNCARISCAAEALLRKRPAAVVRPGAWLVDWKSLEQQPKLSQLIS
ncbi:MAG: hypothetical protein RJA70_1719 [Pseudomonadota bacterium]